MLSSTEIQKLYDHVEKHKVVFVDVQIELVDHLASEIESIQVEYPSTDFGTALAKASEKFKESSYGLKPYGKYGKTKYTKGFKGLINQKFYVAATYLYRRMNDYLLSFFKLPRIILTLSMWIVLYKLIELGDVKIVVRSIIVFQLIALVYWVFKTQLFQRTYGKFVCFSLQFFSPIGMFPMCYAYWIVQFIKWLESTTLYFPFVTSSVLTFWILSIYIGQIYFTDLLITEIKDKYGNHKLNFG